MKFLIIHNRYSTAGGEERVFGMQCDILRAAGHQVVIYERRYDEIRNWPLRRVASLFSSLYNRGAVRQIKEIIATQRPDIALVHNLFPVISPAILPILHRAKVPVIMTLHNFRLVCPTGIFFRDGALCERCPQSPWREWCCAAGRCEGTWAGSVAYALRSFWARKRGYYLRNVDTFVALSEFQRQKLGQYGVPLSRMVVIPNPVEIPAQNTDTQRDNFIGVVGRLSIEKGAGLLFDVARSMPSVRFRVAGALMCDAETMGQKPDNIELLGVLDRAALDLFYASALAVVSCSICYETFGLVIAEAMVRGAVGIVPQLASMGELVDNGRVGIVYRAGDPQALRGAIERVTTDKALSAQLSNDGRRYISSQYSTAIYCARLVEQAERLKQEDSYKK